MRKNVWIGLFVAGAQTLPIGPVLIGYGVWTYLLFAPLFSWFPPGFFLASLLAGLIYGMMIAGVILTIVGIILIAVGYRKYRAEREFDVQEGLRAKGFG